MSAQFLLQTKRDRLSLFLKHFEALEEVTQALNEKFSVELGVCMLYGSITLNGYLYDVCSTIPKNDFNKFFSSLPQIFIFLIEICLISDSGTWVTKEVRVIFSFEAKST
jgi:hypothetical protein